MRRVALEHRLVRFDRPADVPEARLVDVSEAHREYELGGCVPSFLGEVDLRAQQAGELLVEAFLFVELGEVHDRGRFGRIVEENAAKRLDGVFIGRRGLQFGEFEA